MGSDLLATFDDPAELAELGVSLAVQDRGFGHCMCYGDTAFQLLQADGVALAVLGLHHGQSIRWDVWSTDTALVRGRNLLEWLASKGVDGPLAQFLTDEQQRRSAIGRTPGGSQRFHNH